MKIEEIAEKVKAAVEAKELLARAMNAFASDLPVRVAIGAVLEAESKELLKEAVTAAKAFHEQQEAKKAAALKVAQEKHHAAKSEVA